VSAGAWALLSVGGVCAPNATFQASDRGYFGFRLERDSLWHRCANLGRSSPPAGRSGKANDGFRTRGRTAAAWRMGSVLAWTEGPTQSEQGASLQVLVGGGDWHHPGRANPHWSLSRGPRALHRRLGAPPTRARASGSWGEGRPWSPHEAAPRSGGRGAAAPVVIVTDVGAPHILCPGSGGSVAPGSHRRRAIDGHGRRRRLAILWRSRPRTMER
jgi:hypothetical protein